MEDPQEDHLAVHCFCVCSGSALLGDLLGVCRSMERDLLFVLLIYPRIFLCLLVFIAYRLLVGLLFVWLYSTICSSVSCFGLVVSTCQVIGYRKTPLMTPSWGEMISTKPRWKCLCVFFFCLVYLCCYVFPLALHDIYFIPLWHDIAYLCWKCH